MHGWKVTRSAALASMRYLSRTGYFRDFYLIENNGAAPGTHTKVLSGAQLPPAVYAQVGKVRFPLADNRSVDQGTHAVLAHLNDGFISLSNISADGGFCGVADRFVPVDHFKSANDVAL